jgi:hypothetical protein
VLIIMLAFVIGHFIGWVYMWTHKGLSYSQTFVASLVVVPVIVAVMMLLMSSNLMIAFGLLAVFAVVRFRNVLKDTRDTVFILWSIMEGLGVGTMRFSTSVIGAIGVAMILIYLRIAAFGSRHRFDAVLSFQLTGDVNRMLTEVRQLLWQHCSRTLLANQQRISPQAANYSYRVLLRDPARSAELQSALEHRDGVGNVSLFLREDESEV